MNYRKFGNTGLWVSELCMGAMTFGGTGVFEAIGALGQEDASKLVHRALDGEAQGPRDSEVAPIDWLRDRSGAPSEVPA